MELQGKTALLSGATGGLGRAIAAALAERGASLVLSSRKGEELERMAEELPGEHRTIVADLAEEGAAERLIAEAGHLDVLVANAGLPAAGRLDGFTQEEIGRALRVNLESPVRMARDLLPEMQERGEGHLLFISSVSGRAPTARASLYAATKFGLRGFAYCLRNDLRGTGVGVSVITPGAIGHAGMFADSGAKGPPGLGAGKPGQVGAAVVKAIERNRAEIMVAPLRQRLLAKLGATTPELAGRLTAGLQAKVADEIAAGQTEKR